MAKLTEVSPRIEDKMGMHDQVYIPAMTRRVADSVKEIFKPLSGADSEQRNWGMRQLLLQTFRIHGFEMVLHPGDVGYHDTELREIFDEAQKNLNEKAATPVLEAGETGGPIE